MAKEPVYHLDECRDCAHRHVCKFVSKIDNLLKRGDLPLDLSGASCNEYVPEDVIDEGWRDYQQDELLSYAKGDVEATQAMFESMHMQQQLDPEYLLNTLDAAMADILDKGKHIHAVFMCRKTMEILRTLTNTTADLSYIQLVDGFVVPVLLDENLKTGVFALEII